MSRPSREDRALRRLAHRNAALIALDAEAGHFGVFSEGDRRRRPLARVDGATVARWRAEGVVQAQSGRPAAYVLSADGQARLRRMGGDDAAFADQHRVLERRTVAVSGGVAETATVNLAESPLVWLTRRGPGGRPFLAPRAFAAGERLRHDYEVAHRAPRVTMAWDAPPTAGGRRGPAAAPINDHGPARAAQRRVEAALAAVGPGLDRVLRAVCCDGQGLAAVEKAFGWPQRSGKVMVRLALDRLADHYGLADPEANRPAT